MDEKIDSKEIGEGRKGGINPKVFIIGLPLFIVQLVVVYFITGNFLLSRMEKQLLSQADKEETENVSHDKKTDKKKKKKGAEEATGNFIFTVDDIIINPAGTNGNKLMLISVGFGVETDQEAKVLKEKEVLLKDIVINTVSGKTLDELRQTGYKDTLKAEFSKLISDKIPEVEISNVMFSKYIFQ
ncbi:MAG: flagellar basal body-associated FliL family protein [Ignavibacteria bacterium]|nr:flagellar basal body-associated FliL family protein [Ignavibacteria bacterium]